MRCKPCLCVFQGKVFFNSVTLTMQLTISISPDLFRLRLWLSWINDIIFAFHLVSFPRVCNCFACLRYGNFVIKCNYVFQTNNMKERLENCSNYVIFVVIFATNIWPALIREVCFHLEVYGCEIYCH